MARFMQLFFGARWRMIEVFGARDDFRELFPFLTYEKEFATDTGDFISKPRFPGHHGPLLSGRTAQAAVADLLRPSLRVCLSPDHAGNAAGAGGLVFGERLDGPAAEAGAATRGIHEGLFLVPPD